MITDSQPLPTIPTSRITPNEKKKKEKEDSYSSKEFRANSYSSVKTNVPTNQQEVKYGLNIKESPISTTARNGNTHGVIKRNPILSMNKNNQSNNPKSINKSSSVSRNDEVVFIFSFNE